MTSIGMLAARVLKIQDESLRRIAGVQNLGRVWPDRSVVSKLSEFSQMQAILMLARAFTRWSRAIQGISFRGTYFDPVSMAAAFIATLRSQAGSGFLEPRLVEEFYVDWQIAPRAIGRLARLTAQEEGRGENAQLPPGPATIYERPSIPSLLPKEVEAREPPAEPLGTRMQWLAEEIGFRVRSLRRLAYSNDDFARTAILHAKNASRPVNILLTRFDRASRGIGAAQMPHVFSETARDILASQAHEVSSRLLAVLRQDEEVERETLQELVDISRTSLEPRTSTESANGGSIRERLIRLLDLPLRRLRRDYSRYSSPLQSVTLVLSPIMASISEAVSRTALEGERISMQAVSTPGAISPAEALTYTLALVPTRYAASGPPTAMTIEMPPLPKTIGAAAMYMYSSTETMKRLLSPLPGVISTATTLSGFSIPTLEAEARRLMPILGTQAMPKAGTAETITVERRFGVGSIAGWMRMLQQAAIAVQRRFAEAVNDVSGYALRVYKPLIQTVRGVSSPSQLATIGSQTYADSRRDLGRRSIPQMLGEESSPYPNLFLYGLPISDVAAMAVASRNTSPRAVSLADGRLQPSVAIEDTLTAWSILPQRQIEMIRPYTAVMHDLISYASTPSSSTAVVPPQVPDGLPSARLHDAVSFLLSAQQTATKETPPPARQERVVRKPLPVTIEVDSLRGEAEIRDLQRKIARIIKDEARRYGVYS